MTNTTVYRIQYYKKTGKNRNQWHYVPNRTFKNKEDAQEYADSNKMGFGEMRVVPQCTTDTQK